MNPHADLACFRASSARSGGRSGGMSAADLHNAYPGCIEIVSINTGGGPCLQPCKPVNHQNDQLVDREAIGRKHRFCAAGSMTRERLERAPLFVSQLRHCTPVSGSRGGCSLPVRPRIGSITGPILFIATVAKFPTLCMSIFLTDSEAAVVPGPALSTASDLFLCALQQNPNSLAFCQQHDTSSDRTASSRMLPSVLGSIRAVAPLWTMDRADR
jgi:hypothetical protein